MASMERLIESAEDEADGGCGLTSTIIPRGIILVNQCEFKIKIIGREE